MIEKILERLEKEANNVITNIFASEEDDHEGIENNAKADAYERAIEIAQEVAKEYDWISVTKKLPEEHKRALVELSNGWQVVATHDGEEWVLVWHYYMPIETDYVKVVQWRYLDAPYQKGE